MINTIKENFNRALYALIFSIITIGTLSFLEFETPYGLFLAGSFGSSMVLLFGYPESPTITLKIKKYDKYNKREF